MPLTLHDFDRFIAAQHHDPHSAFRTVWPDGFALMTALTSAECDDLAYAIGQAGSGALVMAARDSKPGKYSGPCVSLDGVARDATDAQFEGMWCGVGILRCNEMPPELVFERALASGA